MKLLTYNLLWLLMSHIYIYIYIYKPTILCDKNMPGKMHAYPAPSMIVLEVMFNVLLKSSSSWKKGTKSSTVKCF